MGTRPVGNVGRWGAGALASVLLAGVGLLLATLAAAQSDPVGVVTDIYIADPNCCGGSNGGVIRVNPLGTQTVLSSGGNFIQPVGIARDAASGDLFVADTSCCGGLNGGVIRVNPLGTQTVLSSGGNFVDPGGIARDAASGDLYVADFSCCGGLNGGVIRVNPQGTQTVLSLDFARW